MPSTEMEILWVDGAGSILGDKVKSGKVKSQKGPS